MAGPAHDDTADGDSVSDLFAFSLPVLERDAPAETSTRPSTSRRPLTAFGSNQPPGTGRRPDDQAEQDVADNSFAFAVPTSGSQEDDTQSVERPTTARPKTSFGGGEASAFGSFASRPQTATSVRSPPVSLVSTAACSKCPIKRLTCSPEFQSQPYSNSPVTPGGARFPPPEILVEEDDEDDDDDDCGMFSFHRPATGEAPPPGSMVPIEVAFQGQGFDFMRSPPKTNDSEEPTTPAESAFASDSVDVRDEVEHQAEEQERRGTAQTSLRRRSRSDESSLHEGEESRGVWHLPDDPDRFTSDPFDARLFAGGRRFGDDGASDKDEIMSSADGRTTGISLHHLGLSGPSSSLDDTKVVDLEAAGIRRRRRPQPLEDSVYPEVQASVSNIDDPTACVLTLRVWFLGLLFCLVFSALNTYFVLRYPAPLITPIITQIFAYPFGRFLAKYMPAVELKLPTWVRWLGMPNSVSLNPGPFSIKEHALLVIMANVSTSPALALNYSVAAEKFYGEPQSAGFDILLVFTTQMIGFGAAGLCRRFLVWPASMLWPQNLVFCTLLNTFHAEIEDEEPGPSRLRFFAYVFCGAFCWFWLPGEQLSPTRPTFVLRCSR